MSGRMMLMTVAQWCAVQEKAVEGSADTSFISEMITDVRVRNRWLYVRRYSLGILNTVIYAPVAVTKVQAEAFDPKTEFVQYLYNERGDRDGVLIKSGDKVGWAVVHPEDRKKVALNWKYARDFARSRGVPLSAGIEHIVKCIPYRHMDAARAFVDKALAFSRKAKV